MKRLFTILNITATLLFYSNHIYAQKNIIETLKDFYDSADKECYIDLLQNEVTKNYNRLDSLWKLQIKSSPPLIRDHKNLTFLLNVVFINTESYTYEDNIYDYLAIDSTGVFTLACLNRWKRVHGFFNYQSYSGYASTSKKNLIYCKSCRKSCLKKNKNLRHVIKNIMKEKPEVLLYCNELANMINENSFLFIKGYKIYVYEINRHIITELNEYLKINFTTTTIRELNVIDWDKNGPTLKTGRTPKEKLQLCP